MIEIVIVIAIISAGITGACAFWMGVCEGRKRQASSSAPLAVHSADLRVVADRLHSIADTADEAEEAGNELHMKLDVMEMFRIAQAVRMASTKKPCGQESEDGQETSRKDA